MGSGGAAGGRAGAAGDGSRPPSEGGASGNSVPPAAGGAGGKTVPPNEGGAGGNTVPPSDGGAAGNTLPPSDGGGGGKAVPPNDGSADGNTDGSSDAPMDPPRPDVAGLCTGDGWCWTHPLPTGDRFVRAFGIGADEVWALSASGAIARFHSNGTWDAVPSPMPELCALWGLSATDVYAGGADGVYHWDGHSWQPLEMRTSPGMRPVYDIWGCGPGDFWAVGILVGHWKDNDWSFLPLPDADGFGIAKTVWGSACNDVFAGGTVPSSGDGRIIHWDGNAWSPSAAMPSEKSLARPPATFGRWRTARYRAGTAADGRRRRSVGSSGICSRRARAKSEYSTTPTPSRCSRT